MKDLLLRTMSIYSPQPAEACVFLISLHPFVRLQERSIRNSAVVLGVECRQLGVQPHGGLGSLAGVPSPPSQGCR